MKIEVRFLSHSKYDRDQISLKKKKVVLALLSGIWD